MLWLGSHLLIDCKSEDSVKQNLYKYVGESTSTFASEKGPPLADVERLKGNMRRELRNEKYPFNCTDFASPKAHGHFGYWWRSQRKGLELINYYGEDVWFVAC